MSKRTKFLVSIIVSFAVLIISTGLLIYFLIKEDKNNSSNNPPSTETIDKYTPENKLLMTNALKELFAIDDNNNQEIWLNEYIDKTIISVADSFEKAGIDIKIFNYMVNYLSTIKSKIANINFDITGIIDGDKISIAQLMQIFGQTDNFNAMYNLFGDFYASGITNLELGRFLYYFIEEQITLIDEYSLDIIKSVNVTTSSNEVQTLLSGLIIDITTILNENFGSISVDEFAKAIEGVLNSLSNFVRLYEKLNIYQVVEMFENIKNGNISADELETLVQSLKADLTNMVDPETGKLISLPTESYKIIFSITTKLPAITQLLKLANVPIPDSFDIAEYINPIINLIPKVEDFINRFFNGILNVLDKINNTTVLNVVGEDGEQYIAQTTLAQAIIDNIKQITQNGNIEINSNTFIILSKLLSGLFDTNSLNINFIDSFMNNIDPILNLVIDISGVNDIDSLEMINSYVSNFKIAISTINVLANQDLGTSENQLLDIAPNLFLIYDKLESFITSIYNKDYFTAQQIVIGTAIFLIIPIIVIGIPAFVVSLPITMIFALPFIAIGLGTVVIFVAVIPILIALDVGGLDIKWEHMFEYEYLLNLIKAIMSDMGHEVTADNYFELFGSIINIGATYVVEWFRTQMGWQPVQTI